MKAIYVRQSVDKKDSISIESQIEKCKSELNDNEEYKVYSDKGFSGKNTDRPMFIQMFKDIQQGLIDKVIVYKVDRISRAIVDFGAMMEKFKKYNVEFVSFSEKFDTTSPIGMAMLNIIMVFAQLERETIQQRIKDNYYERGKQGYYLGGAAPYGFIKIATQLKGKKTYTYNNDPIKMPIVKWIYNIYTTTDISINKIAKTLNEKSLKTNNNNIWSSVAISRILKNPSYVKANADVYLYLKNRGATMNNDVTDYIGTNGCYLYAPRQGVTTGRFTDLTKSFVTLGMHQGSIEASTWLKAQDKMKNNKQIKNSKHGTHSWLSGLMKCGYCGMAITVVPNSRKHNYINCDGRKLHICYGRKKVIHLEDIENNVEKALLQHIQDYYNKIKNININDTSININTAKENEFKIQLVQIDQKISNLINAIAESNDTTVSYINKSISDLDIKRKTIVNQIESYKKAQIKNEKINSLNLIECINDWGKYDIQKRKIIAQTFIEKVTISDNNIDIKFTEH
jgi:DNA invertase Pin-like site-specific DNA recombinase